MIEPGHGAIIPYVATMSLTTRTKPTSDGALRQAGLPRKYLETVCLRDGVETPFPVSLLVNHHGEIEISKHAQSDLAAAAPLRRRKPNMFLIRIGSANSSSVVRRWFFMPLPQSL
jgi:hypothetical protein